jgi:diguanylate cyclase (GGDEF)-like protein
MVLQVPARKMSGLIVANNRNEGMLLRASLCDSLDKNAGHFEVIDDVKAAYSYYLQNHPDIVMTVGLPSAYSEALIIRIRRIDGDRHTGVIVLAPICDSFDRLAEDNFFAGADDVVSANLSAIILKSKLITVFNLKIATDNLRTAVHKLHRLALTDELTGLANMRGFLKKFEASLAELGDRGFAVVMMDLDKFKRINDTTNHMVGSHLIKRVGKILRDNAFMSQYDYAARYGGDEYIFVLHGSDIDEQIHKVDQIRAEVAATKFEFQGHSLSITASFGLCWVDSRFTGAPENIVKAADSMLYQSKDLGRNRVTCCRFDEKSEAPTLLGPRDGKVA